LAPSLGGEIWWDEAWSATSAGGVSQLQEGVDGADHGALAPDLSEPSQQELAGASDLLHLPEHQLDHLLSQPVVALPA